MEKRVGPLSVFPYLGKTQRRPCYSSPFGWGRPIHKATVPRHFFKGQDARKSFKRPDTTILLSAAADVQTARASDVGFDMRIATRAVGHIDDAVNARHLATPEQLMKRTSKVRTMPSTRARNHGNLPSVPVGARRLPARRLMHAGRRPCCAPQRVIWAP